MKARIMVVDDHAIVLHGLKELINSEPDLEVGLAVAAIVYGLGMRFSMRALQEPAHASG